MIQNRITRFDIAQEIDQRSSIDLRPRQRSHDEVEISRGKPLFPEFLLSLFNSLEFLPPVFRLPKFLLS
jgi:hypothetical protein